MQSLFSHACYLSHADHRIGRLAPTILGKEYKVQDLLQVKIFYSELCRYPLSTFHIYIYLHYYNEWPTGTIRMQGTV